MKDHTRKESLGSDNVDSDEEFPSSGGTLTNFNLNKRSFYKTNSTGVSRSVTRLSKEIPSYKLDGAKLLVNRLEAQLKRKFHSFIEVSLILNISYYRLCKIVRT